MRITFVLAAFDLAGGERVIAFYADALRRRGHQVTAIARPLPGFSVGDRLKAFVRRQRLPNWAERSYHFQSVDVPHREIDRVRPIVDSDVPDADVIVATWWETAHWVNAMAPAKGAKVHFIQHYEAFDYTSKGGVDAALRLPFPKIVIARWLEELLRDELGVREDITLVSNAIDTRRFNAPPRGQQAVPTIGMTYSEAAWKGCADGFAAFELVRRRLPDARLITFGSADPYPELPLPEGATHYARPTQEQIRQLYASCDVWLCPSISEGFGLPPFEAMACRTPVVSTRMGGPAEFIRDGENGYLCPVRDVDALAAALVDVLQFNPERWQAMSAAALATIEGYTPDDATDRFEGALIRAAAGQVAEIAR